MGITISGFFVGRAWNVFGMSDPFAASAAPGLGKPGLVDAAGVRHRPAGPSPRIVSLVPSITETLFAIGLEEAVVGRTAFCLHPKGRVKRAKSVGGTKRINRSKLEALAPTHVIVNVDETPRELAAELSAAGYGVIVTHPVEVEDNLSLYRLLGGLFGREAEAEALCRAFLVEAEDLAEVTAALPERRVLYLIWKEPWMTVSPDTYIARMLARIRWRTIAGDPCVRYPEVAINATLLAETDLVLFSTEPFLFTESHLQAFRGAHPEHAGKAMLIDAEMISWYGSRAIHGLRYLRKLASLSLPALA
jgi:ABC-type Fe3+-hydroxamate transport system substrate-binding protein